MKKMWKGFLLVCDYLNGNFAYKNYCDHASKNHPHEKILDKKSFLRDKEKSKWQKINRCC